MARHPWSGKLGGRPRKQNSLATTAGRCSNTRVFPPRFCAKANGYLKTNSNEGSREFPLVIDSEDDNEVVRSLDWQEMCYQVQSIQASVDSLNRELQLLHSSLLTQVKAPINTQISSKWGTRPCHEKKVSTVDSVSVQDRLQSGWQSKFVTKVESEGKLLTPNEWKLFEAILAWTSKPNFIILIDGKNDDAILVLPRKMQFVFPPPKGMIMSREEVVVATYIFGEKKDLHETLVDTDTIDGKRQVFFTLCPDTWIIDDILTMVVCRLTCKDRTYGDQKRWYLPPYFAQLVTTPTFTVKKAIHDFKIPFMNTVEKCSKIFIPLNDDNCHWYLMIVDLVHHKLLLIDSYPSKARHSYRKGMILRVAMFLEHMLRERCFYDYESTQPLKLSEFEFSMPDDVPKQTNGCDCGIWVCEWMERSDRLGHYNVGTIDECNRMRIAVDLVLDKYNKKRDEILNCAAQEMQQHAEHIRLLN